MSERRKTGTWHAFGSAQGGIGASGKFSERRFVARQASRLLEAHLSITRSDTAENEVALFSQRNVNGALQHQT